MNRMLPFTLLSITLAGCASTYTLSPDAKNYRASLTDATAVATVKRDVEPAADQAGVCASGQDIALQKATLVDVTSNDIVYKGQYEVMTGTSAGPTMGGSPTVDIHYRIYNGQWSMNFRQLAKIRVKTEEKGYSCKNSKNGYLLMLYPKNGKVLEVNVSKAKLGHLVAALSYLSPRAELVEGLGL